MPPIYMFQKKSLSFLRILRAWGNLSISAVKHCSDMSK